MHTGYDNFWMYENRRPEPLLSLPVNDVFSDAVFTDSYKKAQNGRLPSFMSNYKPPQNSAVSSCQNDHRRMTGSQILWPSSAYSCPSRPAYANNFYFQGFSTQPNHIRHSSEKNHVLKNLGSNFAQMCKKNNSHSNYIYTQSYKTNNAWTSRIRVKDISSLNDNRIQNSLSENSLYHQKKGSEFDLNQRVNHDRTWDSDTQAEFVDYGKVSLSASNQHIPTYQPRAKEQCSSSNQHQYLQNLEEFYDQNFQFSSDSQFHCSNNNEVPKDSSVDIAINNTLSATRELLSAKNVQEQSQKPIQKPVCDTLQRSKRVKINPKRNFSELISLYKSRSFINTEITNNALHAGSLQQSERLIQDKSDVNVVTDIHQNLESFSNINQSNESLNQTSACSELRKWRKSGQNPSCNSPSFNHVNSQENSTIKITIPHTGQSTVISFNDSDSINKNHTFSLPCLLDFNDNINRNEIGTSSLKSPTQNLKNTQESEKITFSAFLADKSLINHNTSHHTNPICSISPSTTQSNCDFNVAERRDCSFRTSIISQLRNLLSCEQSLNQKESAVGCENVENQNGLLLNQNTLSDNAHENSNPVIPNNISTEAFPLNETNINVLTIKQEVLHPRLEIPDAQHNQKTLQDEIFHQNIKTEKSPEENFEIDEQKAKLQPTENPNPSQEVLPTDADNTENIDFTQANSEENAFTVKKLGPKSKTMSSALKDVKNRITKPDLLTEISVKEKNSPIENECERGKKKCESGKNYKSQINRDKLDLLIQFLRKDEEINASKAKNRSLKKSSSNKRAKETNANHNRRKLSKTCIVKNKNNSREMVSLVSHKTRVEVNKSTSKTPAIAQENTNSNQTDEREATTSVEEIKNDRNVERFEKQTKLNEPVDEVAHAHKEEDSFISGQQSMIESKELKKVSEKITAEKFDNQEEKNLMSTMQALQKLKTHFCMSCDLVSSIDSFWINVVSGELRCLNCFKKITLVVEENISIVESNGLICDSETNSAKKKSIINENYSQDEDRSKNVKSDCARQKTHDLSENVKYKPLEAQNLSVKGKLIPKTDGEQACKFDYKNDAFQNKIKNLEEPKTFKVEESFEKYVKKNNKSKENIDLKAKVLEVVKLNITEPCDSLKSSTNDIEIADEMRKSEENILLVKSRKRSTSGENYSAVKALTLSHSEPFLNDSVMKYATKDGNYSPEDNHFAKGCQKTDIPEEKKGEATDKSDRSNTKIIHKEKNVCETLIKKETNKGTDSQNPTVKRRNSKDFGSYKVRALEENTKTETKQGMSSFVKKLDLFEYSACERNHPAEEISKKNTEYDGLNKSKVQNKVLQDSIKVNATELCDNLKRKSFTKDTEIADKKRKSEENISPVKSRKKSISSENCSAIKPPTLSHSEPFGSKDGYPDQKQKTTEQKKEKEKHSEEESLRNSSSCHKVSETNKKIESVEHSRKRKNSSECHGIHKVRIVEEHMNKAIKQATHVADNKIKSKTNFTKEDKNKIAHEKSNSLDSMEKLRKNRLSKELAEDSNEKSKKETKQDFDSLHSDETNTKGAVKTDKTCEKTKTSHHSKHKTNDSMDTYRRKSQGESTSSKHTISREHSKKAVESPYHMKKNNIFKKEVNFYKIPVHSTIKIKHNSSFHEKSENRKLIVGKIPKVMHPDLEENEIFRSPLSDGQLRQSNETSNPSKDVGIVKIRSTNRRDKLINTESVARIQKKKEESEEGDKKARKEDSQSHTTANSSEISKTGFDKKQKVSEGRSDKNKQSDILVGQKRNHVNVESLFDCKKDTVLKECRQITTENGKVQSNELMAKLIKKTKKLSWSLLDEAKKI